MATDTRQPLGWCTYRGDQRAILTPGANPVPTMLVPVATAFGEFHVTVGMLGLTMRGPNTMGEALWPVCADYDPDTDTTRVGWSWQAPPGE